MGEMRFTPGPWEVASAGSFKNSLYTREEVFVRRPEDDIAIASDIVDPDTSEPSDANAHLIAAAPDLYAALEKMTAFVATWRDCLEGVQMSEATFHRDSGLAEARAALRKAEGRTR